MKKQETILQFGAGKFIRSFADLFFQEANEAGQNAGSVVVIQSTDGNRADYINSQDGRYHVLVRGIQDGKQIDKIKEVNSISRALSAQSQWQEILDVAASPDIGIILSNTTEIGYQVQPADRLDATVPNSFPARLLALLHKRYVSCGTPVTVIPCELIDNNADTLRAIVKDLATFRAMDKSFIEWMTKDVQWLNTLVDRITSDPPSDHPMFDQDKLLTVTEPFSLWVVEKTEAGDSLIDHEAIVRTEDVRPYALRKVRILNGAHTALVCKAKPMGLETVRDAVLNEEIRTWLHDLLYEEIIPAVEDRITEPDLFARDCLDRFSNPYLVHKLESIAWEHETKLRLRLLPTYHDYVAKFGKEPRNLKKLLSGHM